METVLEKTDASAQTVKNIIEQVTGQLEGFGKELQAARTEGIDVAMQAKERAEEEKQKRLEQYRQSMNKVRELRKYLKIFSENCADVLFNFS